MVPEIDKKVILVAVFVPMLLLVNLAPECLATEKFEPSWGSLKEHECPEWFRDAKFGCWFCWVPGSLVTDQEAFKAEWFGRNMYEAQHPAFQYMKEIYGDQKEFGYKDLIPLATMNRFNAHQVASLFKRAGAKFAGGIAIFHDNYAMWDSQVTRWNSMALGPKRDIMGELAQAVRQAGMKFLPTFHHAFAWVFYEPAYKYDAGDPQYADLYGQPHEPSVSREGKISPTTAYLDTWLALVNEMVTKYEPDMLWFDFGLERVIGRRPEYQKRMFADYYNWAEGKGKQVAVAHKHRSIHEFTGILDFERGREDRLTEYAWLTDTTLSSTWFYHKTSTYTPVNHLIDMLVDIVSKNGCLFLNIPMRGDGSFPEQGVASLESIGLWLAVNGEAIYETRPWLTYGEGPTSQAKRGGFSERQDMPFTSQDIRFTRTKDGRTLYAIVLDWPGEQLTIRSMRVNRRDPSARVQLLGYDADVSYQLNDDKQLVIDVPDLKPEGRPCRHAFTFKLSGFDVVLH